MPGSVAKELWSSPWRLVLSAPGTAFRLVDVSNGSRLVVELAGRTVQFQPEDAVYKCLVLGLLLVREFAAPKLTLTSGGYWPGLFAAVVPLRTSTSCGQAPQRRRSRLIYKMCKMGKLNENGHSIRVVTRLFQTQTRSE